MYKAGANAIDQNRIAKMVKDGKDIDAISKTLMIDAEVVKRFAKPANKPADKK